MTDDEDEELDREEELEEWREEEGRTRLERRRPGMTCRLQLIRLQIELDALVIFDTLKSKHNLSRYTQV